MEKYISNLILVIELINLMARKDLRTWKLVNRDYTS